jgi:hypothetical protein
VYGGRGQAKYAINNAIDFFAQEKTDDLAVSLGKAIQNLNHIAQTRKQCTSVFQFSYDNQSSEIAEPISCLHKGKEPGKAIPEAGHGGP